MLTFTLRRLLMSIPTLLFIAFVIFMLLELAPGDPMSQMPLTIPPEVKEKMRLALGLGEPWWVRFPLWLKQFFIVEPQYWWDAAFGTNFADGAQRIELSTHVPGRLLLHWGVEGGPGYHGGWRLPPDYCWPPGTYNYKLRALQTPFPAERDAEGRATLVLTLPAKERSDVLNFVLKEVRVPYFCFILHFNILNIYIHIHICKM